MFSLKCSTSSKLSVPLCSAGTERKSAVSGSVRSGVSGVSGVSGSSGNATLSSPWSTATSISSASRIVPPFTRSESATSVAESASSSPVVSWYSKRSVLPPEPETYDALRSLSPTLTTT